MRMSYSNRRRRRIGATEPNPRLPRLILVCMWCGRQQTMMEQELQRMVREMEDKYRAQAFEALDVELQQMRDPDAQPPSLYPPLPEPATGGAPVAIRKPSNTGWTPIA